MKRRKLAWLVPVAGLIVFAGPNGVRSDDAVGDVPRVVPYRSEAAVSVAPVRVLVQDLETMLERLGAQPHNVAPRPPEEPTEGAERRRGSRVIKLDTPTVVNRTPYFQFRDVTDRGATPRVTRQKLSDETRRLIAERYRRSLAKKKEAGRN